MNTNQLKEKLTYTQSQIKNQFELLSNEDINEIGESVEKLVSKIQNKYGYSKEKAEEELDHFKKSLSAPPILKIVKDTAEKTQNEKRA